MAESRPVPPASPGRVVPRQYRPGGRPAAAPEKTWIPNKGVRGPARPPVGRRPRRHRPRRPRRRPPGPAALAAAAPAASPAILTAVGLGWSMAELYASVRPRDLKPPPVPPTRGPRAVAPPRRTGSSSRPTCPASARSRTGSSSRYIADQVTVAGAPARRPDHRRRADGARARRLAGPGRRRGDPETDYQLARSVLLFHDALLAALTAADHQTGLAYGLGRAVADLTLRMSPACSRPGASSSGGRPARRTAERAAVTGRRGRRAAAGADRRPARRPGRRHLRLAQGAAHRAAAARAGAMIGSIRQWKLWAASPMWQGAPLDWQAHGREVEHTLTTRASGGGCC